MAKTKPLTEARLIAALKKAGFATRDNVRQILQEIIDQETRPAGKTYKAVTEGVADVARNTLNEFKSFGKTMDNRFDKAASERQEIKRQINDLKADTPTQKEVNEVKRRVERLETLQEK